MYKQLFNRCYWLKKDNKAQSAINMKVAINFRKSLYYIKRQHFSLIITYRTERQYNGNKLHCSVNCLHLLQLQRQS